MTVFLTTHYMEEAEEADYCVVVDSGMVAAKGTPFELKEQYAKDKLSLKGKNMEQLKTMLEEKNIVYTKKADLLEIELQNTMDAMAILKEAEPVLDGFTVVKGSMDDVFLGITGKEIRE